MIKECELCHSKYKRASGKLEICNCCNFVTAGRSYFSRSNQKLYGSSYFKQGDYFSYVDEKEALTRNFKERLSRIKKYISKGRLLEIGSAYGYFLNLAKDTFECEGLEYSREAAHKSMAYTGCKIYNLPIEQFSTTKKYDVIASFDTIEHVKSPREFLQRSHRALRKGGFIFLETGDIEALLPKLQKDHWRLIHPPEHLNYFSARTLSMFLHKFGFKVVKVDRVPFHRTVSQIIFRSYPKLNKLVPDLFKKVSLSINTYDLIFVTAYKK